MRLLFTVFLLGIFTHTFAQDYHQWSEHFGARASLLGGAATAGLGDNATAYYNSAAMAFVEDPSLSISVNAYRIRHLKTTNALGAGINLKGTQLSTAPNLIAGIIPFGKSDKLRLGYALISRRNYTAKYDYLHEADYEIIAETEGKERFIGSYNLFHSIIEYWGGFGVSYKFNDELSFGIAHYGIYREVKYANNYEMSVLPSDRSLGTASSVRSNISFNYWNVKGVFKPSAAFRRENIKLGVTLTTPTFNILGEADVSRNYSIRGLDQLLGTDITIIDRAENVKTIHKEHGSLAIGASYKILENSWIHFTNEMFFSGKSYFVFDPDKSPNTYPAEIDPAITYRFFGEQNFLAYSEQTRAVSNFGIGFESELSSVWDIYFGFRTDFLYNDKPYYTFNTIRIESSKWNLYHASLGMVHQTKSHKTYTIGVECGFTPSKEYYNVADFRTPSIENGLLGNGGSGAFARQISFKILLEIEVGKGRDVTIEDIIE